MNEGCRREGEEKMERTKEQNEGKKTEDGEQPHDKREATEMAKLTQRGREDVGRQ